jgi:hypothetical protein
MSPVLSQLALPGGVVLPDLVVRLGLDLTALALLVRGVHYRLYRRADLFLTFFALNVVVFLVTLLMSRVEMTMGAAFGLFAVFSMLRYRTEGITARDMTYLFLVIGLGLLMAVAPGGVPTLAGIAAAILAGTALLEGGWLGGRERTQPVVYDNVSLLHAASRAALVEDLRSRTGLDVRHVEVEEIDFVRDTARLTVLIRVP